MACYTFCSVYWGLMLCIQTPKSEAILCVNQSVSQCVSIFEDEKTRDRSPRVYIVWQVDWVPVIPSCFVGLYCFQRVVVVVLNCSRFLCVGKILKSFPS